MRNCFTNVDWHLGGRGFIFCKVGVWCNDGCLGEGWLFEMNEGGWLDERGVELKLIAMKNRWGLGGS